MCVCVHIGSLMTWTLLIGCTAVWRGWLVTDWVHDSNISMDGAHVPGWRRCRVETTVQLKDQPNTNTHLLPGLMTWRPTNYEYSRHPSSQQRQCRRHHRVIVIVIHASLKRSYTDCAICRRVKRTVQCEGCTHLLPSCADYCCIIYRMPG